MLSSREQIGYKDQVLIPAGHCRELLAQGMTIHDKGFESGLVNELVYINQGKAVAGSGNGGNVVGQEAGLFAGVGLGGSAEVVAVDVVARVGEYVAQLAVNPVGGAAAVVEMEVREDDIGELRRLHSCAGEGCFESFFALGAVVEAVDGGHLFVKFVAGSVIDQV